MSYVPRRIKIIKPDGTIEELSDADFAKIETPLILLGEPGAGKSETAIAISAARSGQYIRADRVASGATLPSLSADVFTVIDGLDEVQASAAEHPIVAVLKRLDSLNIQKFALTCRAVDWANVQNQRAVESWSARKPVVGHLQPLNNDEIAAMVGEFGTYDEGQERFVKEAERQGALDLARNPQSLRMLLAAISERGWPETKTELYDLACDNLAKETNDFHQSLNPDRPNLETVLAAAGFVCAQLLLSGTRGVNVDGQDDDLFPRPAALASNAIPAREIEAAISSLLFRPSGADGVEPIHRTVAEFLAARWLVGALTKETVSRRRLEATIYSDNTVPGPLRGLHAWLATLDRDRTSHLVSKDPYGCLRYGDTAQYAVPQVRHLISELQNLATIDPLFRGEDWSAQFGGGLARPEVRNELVTLIRNSDIPYQLATVILESLSGTDFAATIRDDLRQVVLDDSMVFATRSRALDALSVDNETENWCDLVQQLRAQSSHNAARLAVEITTEHVQDFDGADIGHTAVNYDRANEEQSVGLSLGMDYRLLPRMTETQLRSAVPVLAAEVPDGRHNRSNFERKVEERLLAAIHTLLEIGTSVDASELWSWLRIVTGDHYRTKDWNTFSVSYFSERPDLRREIQALAFEEATDNEQRWLLNFHFSEIASGLMLQEDDVCYHLAALRTRNDPPPDLPERWKNLVQWVLISRDFEGKAIRLARAQAQGRPELQAILTELESSPRPDWEKKEQERQKRNRAKLNKQEASRHGQFSKIAGSVSEGRHLGALHDIAKAYLGLFHEFSEIDDPIQRVKRFVGSENLEAALQGLSAACQLDDIPTPREAMRLRAEEGKQYYLEEILLVACAVHLAEGRELHTLSKNVLQCALTACQWGLYSNKEQGAVGIQEQLEAVLFAHPNDMAQFVRDTIEPALLAGENHVSGLYEITHQARFANLTGTLALEWLLSSESISSQSLRNLLSAALLWSDRTAWIDLITGKLARDSWPVDEHRNLWIGAAFAADFERFENEVRVLADLGADSLWGLTALTAADRFQEGTRQPLSISQLLFLVETFAPNFPHVEPPRSGWGSQHPYEGALLIANYITQLGERLTHEARDALERIVNNDLIGNHMDHARHVLAEHIRALAEVAWQKHTLDGVRQVLLAGSPATIDDLQSLIMDELDAMQARLTDGTYNSTEPFWNGNQPQIENYCRDRIAEHLEPYLKRFGVRVNTEGTMPDHNRCDLLCTIGEIDLPVEIKGQWHPNVWSAACKQLEDNYSRNYRAEGRGIYLVAWFGNVPRKNPPDSRTEGRPKSARDMLEALPARSPRPISPLTKLFVLDVAKGR